MRSKRRLRVYLATAALAAGTVVAIAPATPAQAHGVAMFPGSRTFLCWQDGLRPNGNIDAFNPACRAAQDQTGTTPLFNWFAVLDSNAGGRTSGYIADNFICSAGNKSTPFDFRAYNANRSDWPLTHLTSGANIQWRYSNWAAHPGSFTLYVTNAGFNPNGPLNWSSLTQFGTVNNPPQSGGPGALNYYFWNMNLPQRTGRHIILIHWIRSDSAENFYSCSDVVFDGGNGEVTGVGPNQSNPPPPPPPPPGPPPPPPPPPPPGPPPPPPPPPAPPPPPPPPGDCNASFRVVGTPWNNGYQGAITVSGGSTAVNGWTVTWTNAAGSLVTQLWNGTHTPSGQNSSVRPAQWNSSIPANGSIEFGFLASRTGTAAPSVSNLTCTRG